MIARSSSDSDTQDARCVVGFVTRQAIAGGLHVALVNVEAACLSFEPSGDDLRRRRWADDGSALVLPKRLQLVSDEANRTYDPATSMSVSLVDIPTTLEHLARNGFLEVERDPRGSTVVRLGPLLREHAAG
ncbi:MAG TPA: hypothetical protein VHI12_02310 [Gaiellaceae bacterium]|jgi:hypothetical protein|nr:hypothetical protein [Gaiellaceae bacterium]